MQESPNRFLLRLGQALRARGEDVAHCPLPRRWVDLIAYLNEREMAEREGSRDAMAGDPAGRKDRPFGT